MTKQELQIQAEEKYVKADREAMAKALESAQKDSKLQQTAVGLRLIKDLSDDMVENFDKYFTAQMTTPAADLLKSKLSDETLAGATASALVDGACAGTVRQEVCEDLANLFIDMLIEKLIADAEGRKASQRIERRLSLINKDACVRNKVEEMRNALHFYAKEYNVDLDAIEEFVHVSQSLIVKMADRAGLFIESDIEIESEEDRVELYFKDVKAFEFHKNTFDKIENLKEFVAENAIKLRPMLCKPLPWNGLLGGGYLTQKYQSKVHMVKGVMSRKEQIEYDSQLHENENFDTLLKSLNAIQETAFIINPHVIALLSQIVDKDADIMGVPTSKKIKAKKGMNKKQINTIAKSEKTRSSKRRAFEATYSLANEFADKDEFYMPYNLDFRGRAYCLVTELSPQGSDLQKGLLLFAEPKKLGDNGHDWLKIHAANCYGHGMDKAPISERIKWVGKNMKMIRMIANGCLTRYFVELMKDKDRAPEDPVLFYAVARELAEIADLPAEKVADYESRIPVSVDGSNNGLQHYAALLRNVTLSEKVNLHVISEDDIPSDVYMKVAEGMIEYFGMKKSAATIAKTIKANKADVAAAIKAVCALASDKHRKLVKRSTMTQAYAVTGYGMLRQIAEVIEDIFTDDAAVAKSENKIQLPEAVYAIAARVTFEGFKEGLRKHCEAAKIGMEFLKKVAAAKGEALTWTTPSGFTARQRYVKTESRMTESYIGKRAVRIKYARRTNKINTNKQKSAVAPNFIHSMDASHMMLMVNDLISKEEFKSSFFMIHDSFGTYAGQMNEMSEAIRRVFVEMYSVNRFEMFLNEANLDDDTARPEVPEFGDFDLNDVKKATYFFA